MRAVRTRGVSSAQALNSLFCRHNRFTAECPICSKGSVLSQSPVAGRTSSGAPARRPKAARRTKEPAVARTFSGPYVSAGPFDTDEGRYEVRLEQVPGGLRLAQWSGGQLQRKAPVLPSGALRQMLADADARGVFDWEEPEAGPEADGAGEGHGASPGRSGDLQEELRVERLPDGSVRIARWLYWPGAGGGWQLQEAPPMLPAQRYAQALTEYFRGQPH